MLAEKTHNYKNLVQIKMENRGDHMAALKIIDQNIMNIKEKVTILQRYAPKLLKKRDDLAE